MFEDRTLVTVREPVGRSREPRVSFMALIMHQVRRFVHLHLFPQHCACDNSSTRTGLGPRRIDTRNQPDVWRRELRVKITWALAAKLLGLLLLWFFFFRASGP